MRRKIRPSARFDEVDFVFYLLCTKSYKPNSYEEAIGGKDVSLWLAAMKDWMLSLDKKQDMDLSKQTKGDKKL